MDMEPTISASNAQGGGVSGAPRRASAAVDLLAEVEWLREIIETIRNLDPPLVEGVIAAQQAESPDAVRQAQDTDAGVESKCQRCGGRNLLSWCVANATWNEIVAERWNILCPICFAELAEQKGKAPTAWWLSREHKENTDE